MMITEIGIIAGEIWHFLDENGQVTLEELINGIDKPKDIVLMSLGWLAREGHVLVKLITNGGYTIRLRQNDEK